MQKRCGNKSYHFVCPSGFLLLLQSCLLFGRSISSNLLVLVRDTERLWVRVRLRLRLWLRLFELQLLDGLCKLVCLEGCKADSSRQSHLHQEYLAR